jgi:hypothetical protein
MSLCKLQLNGLLLLVAETGQSVKWTDYGLQSRGLEIRFWTGQRPWHLSALPFSISSTPILGLNASSYEISTGRSFPEGKSGGCESHHLLHLVSKLTCSSYVRSLSHTSSLRRVYEVRQCAVIYYYYYYYLLLLRKNTIFLCAAGMANDHTDSTPDEVHLKAKLSRYSKQTVSSENTNGGK